MGFFARLRGTFIKNESIQDELEFHIEQRTEELTADGLTKEEAHRQARHELGNPSKWRDETRDADVFITLEDWLRDTRQSLRGLRQRPVFAATAIGSLAIGIGAIASLFAIADAVIWKPIALPGERELYHLQEFVRGQFRGSNGPRLKDWQSLSSVAGATGTYGEPLVWRGPNGNEQVRCLRTYTGLNATIRPTIALGRAFTSEEEAGEPVALATHAFWRDRLNSAASVGGHAIVLSGKSYRIVGVLDTSIGYPEDVDLWVPAPAFYHNGPRVASYLDVIMRLKPGVLRSHAQAELTLAALRLGQAYPKTDAGLGANIVPLREQLGRSGRRLLFLLLAIAACVLAMVCVNIAALLLSRGAERERESGLRTALGASPGSLVRLYMIESGLIAVAGGAIGVLLAIGAVDALKRILPGDLARLSDALVDSRVVAFTFVVSLLAALA